MHGFLQDEEPHALRAYRALERMVVTLDLLPGAVTTEGALIERVGLGRTPVREAIQRLAWEGLLEIRPRAGVAVAPLHPGDWLRILEVRRGVEIILARSAARFPTAVVADRLRGAGNLMNAASMNLDVLAFLEADKVLDEALAMASDNPYAARLAAPLQTHSRRFWFRYQGIHGLGEAAARHQELIEAILAGNETAAEGRAAILMALLTRNAEAVLR